MYEPSRMKKKDKNTINQEVVRPIIDSEEINHGIYFQLVPNNLSIIIYEPGCGSTPKTGEFIRLKQSIYLEDMSLIKQQRITYVFGRKQLIRGLEICLALSREYFKARIMINSEYAYKSQRYPGIPGGANLIIDIQVQSISSEPSNCTDLQDKLLISEIITEAKEADGCIAKGEFQNAQRILQKAFLKINSSRARQIKLYLYNKNKINNMIKQEEKTLEEIEQDKAQLAEIFKVFDTIKIKTIQIALLNKEYYKVLSMSQSCFDQSNLLGNTRVIMARCRAFAQIGQFSLAMADLQNMKDKYPEDVHILNEFNRTVQKKANFEARTKELDCISAPIIAKQKEFFKINKKVKKGQGEDIIEGENLITKNIL